MRRRLGQKIIGYFSRKKEVLAVYLYGSQATGKAGPLSDVDVGVLLSRAHAAKIFEKELQYRGDLERLLKEEVDVVILNDADPFLTQQVYAAGRALFVRRQKEAEALKWRHIRNYWDYLPMKRIMDDTALKRLGK